MQTAKQKMLFHPESDDFKQEHNELMQEYADKECMQRNLEVFEATTGESIEELIRDMELPEDLGF